LSSDTEPASAKAENALTTPTSVGKAESGLYSRREIPLGRPAIEKDNILSPVKLQIPSEKSENYTMARPYIGAGHHGESTNASMGLNEDDDHDMESTASPTDERERTAGADDSQMWSPSLEKKKMKRFR